MTILNDQRVIAIEEHYYDENVVSHYQGVDARIGRFGRDKLLEVGDGRIKSMDEAGIDVQVLSHGAPSTQRIDAETGVFGPFTSARRRWTCPFTSTGPRRIRPSSSPT